MKKIGLILCTIIVFSCKQTPEIRFLEPQPNNIKDLQSFPKAFRGKYLSKTDSSILIIDSKMILHERFGFSKASIAELRQELDTNIQADMQIKLTPNLTMKINIVADSALISTFAKDTVFQISEVNLLRIFKGYLFLNYKNLDSTWRVKTMKLKNGQLDFGSLIDANQIDTLESVTEIVSSIDTATNKIIRYDLNPKRKELREILKQKDTSEIYMKL